MFIKSLLIEVSKFPYPINIADQTSYYENPDFTEFDLISGHWDSGIINSLDNSWFKFSILRDPVDRSISHYFYMKRSTDSSNLRFNRKIEKYKDPYLFWSDKEVMEYHGNLMTKILAGNMWSKNKTIKDHELLEIALYNASKLDFIGKFEEMNMTVSILQKHLNIIKSEDVINQSFRDEVFDLNTISLLKEINILDQELYNNLL